MCGGRQCDEGCCPYSGWVCCEDGLHCADTEAECRPDKLRMEVVKTIDCRYTVDSHSYSV